MRYIICRIIFYVFVALGRLLALLSDEKKLCVMKAGAKVSVGCCVGKTFFVVMDITAINGQL